MYAIVETGGKQYRVSENDLLEVEKLANAVGDKVDLKVIMTVDGDKVKFDGEVKAEVVNHGKDEKILVVKYKAKKHTKKQQGHRQPFTTLKIVSVK